MEKEQVVAVYVSSAYYPNHATYYYVYEYAPDYNADPNVKGSIVAMESQTWQMVVYKILDPTHPLYSTFQTCPTSEAWKTVLSEEDESLHHR